MGSLPSGWVSFRPPARSAWLRAACGPAGAEGNPARFQGLLLRRRSFPAACCWPLTAWSRQQRRNGPTRWSPGRRRRPSRRGKVRDPTCLFLVLAAPGENLFFFFFLIRFKCRSRVCSCYTRAQRSPILPLSPFLYPPPVLLAAPRGRCRFVPGPLPTEARAPGWASGSRAWAPPCKAGNQPFPGLTP